MKIQSETQLLDAIKDDVKSSPLERVVVLGGHFPIARNGEGEVADTAFWGDFSKYTLDLSAQIVNYVRSIGKEADLAIIADDHTYFRSGEGSSKYNSALKRRKRQLYLAASGDEPTLPGNFDSILAQYGLSNDDIITQDQGKAGRRDSRLLSEVLLIREAEEKGFSDNSKCGRAYRAFMQNPQIMNAETDYLVSFIPSPCFKNVCNDVLDSGNVNSSHGFFLFDRDFAQGSTIAQLYETGDVVYRKDVRT